MKKNLFLIATILVAMTACTTREAQPEQVSEPKTITFKARIADPDPDTRVSFTEATEGIKTTFEADDVIYLFDAEGNLTKFTVTDVDGSGVATFSGTPETEIAEGAAVTAVVKNAALSIDAESKTATVNLNNQAGTLASAAAHNLLFASGTYSEQGVSLVFEHKTSLLKLTLSLPEAENATSVKDFYLITVPDRANVTDQKGAQFNYCNYVSVDQTGAVTNGKNGNGWINWTTASPVNDHVVTLYLSVPAVDLKNAALQCTPSSSSQKRYFWNLAGSSPLTIEAGKAYKITRTQTQFVPSAAGKTFFYSDAAQTIDFGLPQGSIVTYEASTGDWLTRETDQYGNLRIHMTANTTGSPRESTLTFKVYGAFCKYSITQANPSDFYGDYTLSAFQIASGQIGDENAFSASWENSSDDTSSRVYKMQSGLTYPSREATIAELTGQSPIQSQKDGTHTNNITIKGFCEDLLAKAELVINYQSTDAHIGLFMMQPLVRATDLNTPVQFTTNGFDPYYAWLFPELNKGSKTYAWTLTFATLGADSYIWYVGNISVSGNTTTVYWKANATDGRDILKTSTAYNIGGVMVNAYTASGSSINVSGGPTSATLLRQVSGIATTGAGSNSAAYRVVYQGDMKLVKTGASASPADINVPSVENTAW